MTEPIDLPFRTLAPWLRETFWRPVHRVALDAGSTCPNRDGTKGLGGCTYCDVEGSGTGALRTGQDLVEQLEAGLARIARRRKRDEPEVGAIAYLQSYTNTYVDQSRFEEVLAAIDPYLGREVVCLSVATRPDCLPDDSLRHLERLRTRVPVWVELGLEAASDEVLFAINRLHTVAEFDDAVARAHAAGLLVVGHAILGLPGDGREGARRTAEVLARSGCAGVKVHQMMVLRRTQLAAQWKRGEVECLDLETYVAWLADFVERLGAEQVLHRLTGDAPVENRLAPDWSPRKNDVRARLAEALEARGTCQGALTPNPA
ncbi:MAG: TIGR01212 family radical SAM protein [Planctomycetota bacterium]|nr:TIGR01212 family radical SAM protein [Planctomycetota bacterium]